MTIQYLWFVFNVTFKLGLVFVAPSLVLGFRQPFFNDDKIVSERLSPPPISTATMSDHILLNESSTNIGLS